MQIEKEKAAIIKRLKAMHHIVDQYGSFSQYEKLVALLDNVGAFHDCPSGKDPGSIDSDQASYASRATAVDR